MVFRFKKLAKYLEAKEYLLRAMASFYYHDAELTIEIDNPDESLVKIMMDICGECEDADSLLAKEIMQDNVAG